MENTATSSLTVDAHIDWPWQFTKRRQLDLKQGASMVDLAKMKQGGLQAAAFALYLSDTMQDGIEDQKVTELVLAQVSAIRLQSEAIVVDSAANAVAAVKNELVPIFLGLEGGRLIHESLLVLAAYRQEGVRYLTLTHNRNTSWADSATDMPKCKGLTRFGLRVIKEAERLGVLVDVSHSSDATCDAVLHVSEMPIIASHSGCRVLLDHPRNLNDRLITKIAKDGGVIHIPFAKRFVHSIKGIADHIDHAVQLIGDTLHTGIGSDLDGAIMPDGIQDVSCWSTVCCESLVKRGYTEKDIQNITGKNTLRMLA